MKRVTIPALAVLFLLPLFAGAEVVKSPVSYRQGDVELQGFVAYDDALPGKAPGVLVVHDWMGVSPFTEGVAEKLAKMGYAAFCADIYGKGVRPKDSKEAAATAGIYRADRNLMRARARAGLDALLATDRADPGRVAVIGYCFGGGVALELARSGAPVTGTVVFHGSLDSPTPQDAANIKGKVLALQGGDDPFVPPEQVAAFIREMRDGKVDWQLTQYGGAVHAYTLPGAGNDNSKGSAYNEKADRRSWEAMKGFFGELFKP